MGGHTLGKLLVSTTIVMNGGRDRNHRMTELLQKQGLHQVADILDRYGIGSATDVSELKEHNFIQWRPEGSSRSS